MKGILRRDLSAINTLYLWIYPLVIISATLNSISFRPAYDALALGSAGWVAVAVYYLSVGEKDPAQMFILPWKRWELVLSRFIWAAVLALISALSKGLLTGINGHPDPLAHGILQFALCMPVAATVICLRYSLNGKLGAGLSAGWAILSMTGGMAVQMWQRNAVYEEWILTLGGGMAEQGYHGLQITLPLALPALAGSLGVAALLYGLTVLILNRKDL